MSRSSSLFLGVFFYSTAVWAQVSPIASQSQIGPAVQITADKITGQVDVKIEAQGDVQFQQGAQQVKAQSLEYTHSDGRARAQGQVEVIHTTGVYQADRADVKLNANEGVIENTSFDFAPKQGRGADASAGLAHISLRTLSGFGQAKVLKLVDEERSEAEDLSFSMCRKNEGPATAQDWFFQADHLSLDRFQNTGVAKGVRLHFLGTRSFKVPSISFALDEGRKSGWLPPSFSADTQDGASFGVPYYWNIAPNRDATITPYLRSRRGLDMGGEFRYLEQDYSGEWQANYLLNDRLRGRDRWGLNLRHRQQIALHSGLNPIALDVLYQRVSDDDYWKDFSRSLADIKGRLHSQSATLGFSQEGWTLQAGVRKWQTLQDLSDTSNNVVPPYNRLPFANLRYRYENLKGFDIDLMAESTRFDADKTKTLQANATRLLGWAQIAYPIQTQGWYIKPKLTLQSNYYGFDESLPLTQSRFSGVNKASFAVPTVSLDTGLALERKTIIGQNAVRQTLEPRAFYVYTPKRDQSGIPIYDSAKRDFNFASIFTENEFSGFDRVSDTHTLTLGVASRFLDDKTGRQWAKLSWAQRLRFANQNVTLPGGEAATDRFSDQLYGITFNINDKWAFDSTVQFNPDTKRTVRSLLGLRYSPSPYRTVSLAYRLQRGESEQYDLGWQWPLGDFWPRARKELAQGTAPVQNQCEGKWYWVGRLNYNQKDKKMADALLGLEYDAGCWVGRFVVEQTQLGSNSRSTRYMLQLELVGLSRISLGANPLTTLKQVIPKYQILNEAP